MNLLRKLCLSGAMVFFKPGSVMQLMFALILGLVFLILFTRVWPFEDKMNNILEFFAELCVFLTLFCSIMGKVSFGPSSGASSDGDVLGVAVPVVQNHCAQAECRRPELASRIPAQRPGMPQKGSCGRAVVGSGHGDGGGHGPHSIGPGIGNVREKPGFGRGGHRQDR